MRVEHILKSMRLDVEHHATSIPDLNYSNKSVNIRTEKIYKLVTLLPEQVQIYQLLMVLTLKHDIDLNGYRCVDKYLMFRYDRLYMNCKDLLSSV